MKSDSKPEITYRKQIVESECSKLTRDVAIKLFEGLKHQTSEEAAQALIYQALGYFKQNYDTLLASQIPQHQELHLPAMTDTISNVQQELEKHKYANNVLKKGVLSFQKKIDELSSLLESKDLSKTALEHRLKDYEDRL